MGNCIRRESRQWAGDDWDFLEEKSLFSSETSLKNKNCSTTAAETAAEGKIYSSSSSAAAMELKIKITKKQLQELLVKANLNELSVQQVLAQLMNVGGESRYESHHRPWRPVLQSIPEGN